MYGHPLPPLPDGGSRRDSYDWDGQLCNTDQQGRPRRPSTADPARPASQHRAQSRFLEGSMNDRVSAAPPPSFLGGEGDVAGAAAWERQFYPRPERAPTARPGTSGGNDASAAATAKKGGFLAPLWDGLQQRFGISRSRSSNHIGTREKEAAAAGRSAAGGLGAAQQQQQYHSQAGPAGDRPTREEVLQSYQNLMASGFFDAHAIRSARQPGPGQQQRLHTMLPPGMLSGSHAGDRASAPPSTSSFAQRMSQQQQQQQQQQQSRSSYPPAASHNTSWSAARPSMNQPPRSPPRPPTYAPPPPPVSPLLPTSPFRGTKRGRTNSDEALDAKAGDNSNGGTALAAAEAGARKLVKKLRKSASRVSVELSLSRPVTAGGGQAVVEDNQGNPIKVPRRTVSIVRSISASFRGDRGAVAPAVPAVPNPPLPAPALAGAGNASAGASLSPVEPAISHRVSFETSNRMSFETSRSNGSSSATYTAATPAVMATAYEQQEETDGGLGAADRNRLKKRDIRGRRLRRQRSRSTDPPAKPRPASRPPTAAAEGSSPFSLPIMRPPEPGGQEDAPPPMPMPMEGVQRAFPLSPAATPSAISAAIVAATATAAAARTPPATPPRPARQPEQQVVPSFHYPQRVRPSPQKPLPPAPLAAVPDLTNRAAAPAPAVPRLPSGTPSPGKRAAYAGSENQGGWWAVR